MNAKFIRFFGAQRALRTNLQSLPIVHLEDGSHVVPSINGETQAFLPGHSETDFPTVREAVCKSKDARAFLESLNLTESDQIDDVIRNVLPKYRQSGVDVSDEQYRLELILMVEAGKMNSQSQKNKLIQVL